jgi:hypothetical protein
MKDWIHQGLFFSNADTNFFILYCSQFTWLPCGCSSVFTLLVQPIIYAVIKYTVVLQVVNVLTEA